MEKRERPSSTHKRPASQSSPRSPGPKRRPEPESMTPGAQGTKPGDKNQNALPLAQRILQDLHVEEPEISPNTSTETLREAEGGAPALILEAGADERKEEEDDGEDAKEDVKVDVEEGAKEDKNQNSLPGRKVGPSRSNGC